MPLIAEDFETIYSPDHQIKTIISLTCDTAEGSLERLRKHLKQANVCIDINNKNSETAASILASQGNVRAVDILIAEGAQRKWVVYGAARGGHTLLVDRFLKKGASKDWAVFGAAQGGRTELVDRLLKKGASRDWAVDGAARGGHTLLVDRLLKEGAHNNDAVYGAARGGHTEFVDRLLKIGASKDWAVLGAALGGDTELVDRLLKLGADIAQAAKNANFVVANWLVLNHQLLLGPRLTPVEKKEFIRKHFNSRYKFVELLVGLQETAHYAKHLNALIGLHPLPVDVDFGDCISIADRLRHLKLILEDRPFAELYKVASSIAGAGLESGLSALTGKNKLSKLPTDLQAHILTFALKPNHNTHSDARRALLPAYTKEQRAIGLLNEVANALSRLEPSKPPQAPKRRCVIL